MAEPIIQMLVTTEGTPITTHVHVEEPTTQTIEVQPAHRAEPEATTTTEEPTLIVAQKG